MTRTKDFYREIGRKGGLKTKRKLGAAHFAKAGHKGGTATKRKHGKQHFRNAGRKGGARISQLIAAGKAAEEHK